MVCFLWPQKHPKISVLVPGANGFPIAFMENLDGSPFSTDVPWCAMMCPRPLDLRVYLELQSFCPMPPVCHGSLSFRGRFFKQPTMGWYGMMPWGENHGSIPEDQPRKWPQRRSLGPEASGPWRRSCEGELPTESAAAMRYRRFVSKNHGCW